MIQTTGWHFDKRIAIDNVLIILINITAVVWIASKMDSRIEMMERESAKIGPIIESLMQNSPNMQYRLQALEDRQVQAVTVLERITKLETQMDNIGELLKIQSNALSRIDQKVSNPDRNAR